MRIVNRHARTLPASADALDARLACLGTEADTLWPAEAWFAMRLDAPPDAGGKGGHGPVRYTCTRRVPGSVTFTFDRILGSDRWRGDHRFDVSPADAGCVLAHTLRLDVPVRQWLQWHLLVGPLHDAVLEDLLDKAESGTPQRRWTPRVRLLRLLFPRVRGRGVSPRSAPGS